MTFHAGPPGAGWLAAPTSKEARVSNLSWNYSWPSVVARDGEPHPRTRARRPRSAASRRRASSRSSPPARPRWARRSPATTTGLPRRRCVGRRDVRQVATRDLARHLPPGGVRVPAAGGAKQHAAGDGEEPPCGGLGQVAKVPRRGAELLRHRRGSRDRGRLPHRRPRRKAGKGVRPLGRRAAAGSSSAATRAAPARSWRRRSHAASSRRAVRQSSPASSRLRRSRSSASTSASSSRRRTTRRSTTA